MIVPAWSFAQGGGTSSALNGTIMDQSGGVIPGAEIVVRNNDTGHEVKGLSAENGTFTIPFLPIGTYTATVTLPGFKQWVANDIKLLAGRPSTITIKLEVGSPSQTMVVQANAELLQASTATITTTMNITQISTLPLASRSVMDFLPNLPGVNTTGSNRNSTINGLPNATINITIDGINTQDNYLKGSVGGDGFFSVIMPRLDAIQEVTVSTATPGSEAAGQGAIQIKFVTRQGNNEYHGSLYEYHQNSGLNANSWFNNRDLAPTYDGGSIACTSDQLAREPGKCKAPRNKAILNQYGFRLGGPIILPKRLFGPLGFDGHDRAFFFINYEESRRPFSQSRTRTIFNPLIDQGVFPYVVGTQIQTVDLFNLAAREGQTATWDPTVKKLLADIRDVSNKEGTTKQQAQPHLMDYFIKNRGVAITQMPTARFDLNLTSRHRIEGSWNFMKYVPSPDTTNSRDPNYPGFPGWGTQGSNRWTTSVALRSTLTSRLANELRFGAQASSVLFSPETNVSQFKTSGVGNQDGYALSLGLITNAHTGSSQSRRNTPTETIEDNLSWVRGTHNLSFGFTFTNVGSWVFSQTMVPGISFGVNSTYDPAYVMFNATNGPRNFPGASTTQISNAAQVYALLTGRVTQISGNGVLNETTNKYAYNGPNVQRGHMREFGLYAADSWRLRPGLSLNYGLRWEVQLPFVPLNDVYTWNTMEDMWGISGVGNLFKPGVQTGRAPTYKLYRAGDPAYGTDFKAFAPSLGFAWSPRFSKGGLASLLGRQTVLRGGFSVAYNRNGMYEYTSMFGANPGLTVSATRNTTNGNLVAANESWPLLFRDKSRLGPPPFAETPNYPLQSTSISDQVNLFDPNTRTPYTMSWSFGIQRELSRSTVLEVRYVATRNFQAWNQRNLNEQNIVENAMLDEFKLAMANLQANLAAGRSSAGFKYMGPGTGTSPLPITLAYFSGVPAASAGDASRYTSTNFTSSTWVNALAMMAPNPSTYASNLWSDAARRANALSAGLPANFFVVNPTVASGGSWLSTNGGFNRYDSMVIELRRRLSRGLLVQANYVWAKGLSSSRLSFRAPYAAVTNDTLPHAFKFNWVYSPPLGRNRLFWSNAPGWINHLIAGWEFQGLGRIQSGNLLNYGNVRLTGMTPDELRAASHLRFDDANKQIYYMPEDIRRNTIAAYNYVATEPTGFSKSYGIPTGRYIAPANTAGCMQIYGGQCAPLTLYVRGPRYWMLDLSAIKQIRFSERTNLELRGEFLNAFNNVNFLGATCAGSSETCGQVTSANNTPRVIQIVLRLNF